MKNLVLVVLCGLSAVVAGLWAWHAASEQSGPQRTVVTPADHPQTANNNRLPGGDNRDATVPVVALQPGCSIVRHYLPRPDGTTVTAFSCQRESTRQAHPYTQYSSDALDSLAYSDAVAAQVLGMRLIEDDTAASLSLVIRAAALAGGDPAPILQFSNAYPHPVSVDGAPQPSVVRVKYVLAAVTALLDGDTSAPNSWEPVIRGQSTDPDRELALLQARARDIIDEMRRIQIEVSGTSTIGGPGDA